MWICAHVGILGNEWVDKWAKQAERRELNYQEQKERVLCGKKSIKSGNNTGIKRPEEDTYTAFKIELVLRRGRRCRKEETVITRSRMEHTNLNSTFCIVGKHPRGLCNNYQERKTVDHVLVESRKYSWREGPWWSDRNWTKEHTGMWRRWTRGGETCGGGETCLIRLLKTTDENLADGLDTAGVMQVQQMPVVQHPECKPPLRSTEED